MSDAHLRTAVERVKVADRLLTTNTKPFAGALKALDLSDLAILELGCGEGHLLRELRHSKAKIIYAFEIDEAHIAEDIKAWASDPDAKPRLIINPSEYKRDETLPDGDFTNYDFLKLLEKEDGFAIVGNPPYFLWNRILSLTGQYLATEDQEMAVLKEKFKGALAVTCASRLTNHPGWEVRAVLHSEDFTPRPTIDQDQCIVQTGFTERYFAEKSEIPEENKPSGYTSRIIGVPQRYIAIHNRDPKADPTDYYPGWGRESGLHR